MMMQDAEAPEPRQGLVSRLRMKAFHSWFVLRRPMTLGVRALVVDRAGRSVFLIRHTYVPGWHLPGGGVETGETVGEALVRELREEGNIELTAPPQLRSIHFNRRNSRRDHVAFFLVEGFRQTAPKAADHEIAEAGFFGLGALPGGVTRATRARLGEVFLGQSASQDW